jgi:hypothetical protein
MSEMMPAIGQQEAMTLYFSALIGVPTLAHSLEKMGYATEEESLEVARATRDTILAETERRLAEARAEAEGGR